MNRHTRYGSTAKSLHWAVATLIAAQVFVGLVMPHIGRNTEVEFWISLHFSLGALTMLAIFFRIAWRLSHAAPASIGLPKWQQWASHATHAALYLLMLVTPVLGWGNVSSRGWDVSLFGLFQLPRLTETGSIIGSAMGDIHVALVYVMLGLIGVHVLAALYHHFVLRDHVLREMLPSLPDSRKAQGIA